MISNNKSIVQEIVPGILIKTKASLGIYAKPEDHFYILAEIETDYNDRARDMLIFYGLTEERFFPVYRWFIKKSIGNGTIDIIA